MKPRIKWSRTGADAHRDHHSSAFEEFDATELYCAKCRRSVPVRKKLLLVLPDGDKYVYLCAYCAGSVGTKFDRKHPPSVISI